MINIYRSPSNDAIIINDLDHAQSKGLSVFQIDELPEGTGSLKTDGVDVWWEAPILPDIEAVKEDTTVTVSNACKESIVSGITVTLPSNRKEEHFSLTEVDQINLFNAKDKIKSGLPTYPYHADGQICRLYPAEDILAITEAAEGHIFYHTTYCNHLFTWIRRVEDVNELYDISYGVSLPEDLNSSLQDLISSMSMINI